MGSVTYEIINRYNKKKKITFDDIKQIYQDETVEELVFTSNPTGVTINKIKFSDGQMLSFSRL